MMRDIVVPGADSVQKPETHVTYSVPEHERADTSGVALKRERNHIQHKAHMFGVTILAILGLHFRIKRYSRLPRVPFGTVGPVEAFLKRTDSGQILVHPKSIGGS